MLGSSLAELLVSKGYDVVCVDIVRKEEAWRLKDVIDKVKYIWKSSVDLTQDDIRDVNIIVDCGLAVADRPLGDASPVHTVLGNIMPALRLLELARRVEPKPVMIYPSSFNALYRHVGAVFKEDTPVAPASIYGWTKAAVEELYRVYHVAYGVPVIITRVGSCFGPKGRSDELPHRLIIACLCGAKRFYLRSPYSKRLWTYMKDALRFYEKLFERLSSGDRDLIGKTLHLAGNRGDKIVTNVELAELIKRLTGREDMEIVPGEYEPGELIYGRPVDFMVDSSYTRRLLNWEPVYTLEEGLAETIEWFRKNLHMYVYC